LRRDIAHITGPRLGKIIALYHEDGKVLPPPTTDRDFAEALHAAR
jgi:hypothetical protein